MVAFLFYIFIEILKKENQVYSRLHLSQAYFWVPGINFLNPFLFILWLDVDLHFGQAFIFCNLK